ncbi:hypothetical protein GE061_002841 [Apolygus lucorum]|uniref:Uncharacterized protein n=1 Tax=Apolygus lucorum TaxID=248454 RepID=A0A8S9X7L5_APOLU|nr:hypothetical protein GE061_002841 [Apolygus lucorum]
MKPEISAPPPTDKAASQHAYRVHQVQSWLGNAPPPEQWGWELKLSLLQPIHTEDPVAPEDVLRLIFCRCTAGCTTSRCGCYKAAMRCSSACHNCLGECANGIPLSVKVDDEDEDDVENF